jgi:integrase
MLLATGARRAEVAEMSWSDIDENVWTIPDPKQGVPHNLTLTPWQMSILPERTTGFVWKSYRGPHITPGNITVRFIKIRNRVGLPGKSLHDMRRTVGTRIAEMTGSAETADRVLGHVLGGVTGRYVVTDFKDLKRDALKLWSDRLEALVS